ncbi:MAG: hypothetical protein II619_02620, partial [Bacilli bacterium]|nr:hypothetical protein [Bacilli bacterium]
SFPHFETSAQKVKPPLKKVKPILFLSETSRFHRCFSASASYGIFSFSVIMGERSNHDIKIPT